MVKDSGKQDSRQSVILLGSQEKRSFYLRRTNNLGARLTDTKLGPQTKTLWGLHRFRIAMNPKGSI